MVNSHGNRSDRRAWSHRRLYFLHVHTGGTKMSDNEHKVIRWIGVVLVVFAVLLFACRLKVAPQLQCGEPKVLIANIVLVAWKDFLSGAVVIAFIWLVRSLWE